jgi:hypothetical protein
MKRMTYTEAQKVLREGEIWDHKATDAERQKAREVIAKIDPDRRCWLGFSDRRECPNMCTGLCGYAKS